MTHLRQRKPGRRRVRQRCRGVHWTAVGDPAASAALARGAGRARRTPALPIPNSFPEEQEKTEFSYTYPTYGVAGADIPQGRWSEGSSIDGRGEFSIELARPLGDEPVLSAPAPEGYAQTEQIEGAPVAQFSNVGSSMPEQQVGGVIDKIKEAVG